jgi:uncharacterized glyoxalase superfamily protein PhnB
MTEEIYPMPSFPRLIVRDLAASSNWYQNVLGFQHIFTMPGPGGRPGLVHLRCVKYADLLLAEARNAKDLSGPKGIGVYLNFNMFDRFDGNIDAFAQQAREKGASLVGPIDQPWNVREVTITDPDGYTLVFTTPLNIHMNFEQVMAQTSPDKKSE